jgi:hypothetical protein
MVIGNDRCVGDSQLTGCIRFRRPHRIGFLRREKISKSQTAQMISSESDNRSRLHWIFFIRGHWILFDQLACSTGPRSRKRDRVAVAVIIDESDRAIARGGTLQRWSFWKKEKTSKSVSWFEV